MLQVFLVAWGLLEAAVLVVLSGHCPPAFADPLRHLVPHSLTTTFTARPPLTAPTPAYLVGTVLAVLGAALRGACYHALGARFTFELSIPSAGGHGHGLVTDGLYGVVRHPSYVGLHMLAVGWLLCALDPRGWVVSVCAAGLSGARWGMDRCARDGIVTPMLACMWATALATLLIGIHQRMGREDAMLERHFGEAWRAWAKKVPYRLVPGVY